MINLKDMHRRVMMTVGRAVVRAILDENSRQQMQIEVTKGELIDGVERMQNYGFTGVPHPGCDAAVVFVSGNREQGIIVVADDRRYRLVGLEAGEVAMYDDLGNKVELLRDKIKITGVTGVETIAPSIKMTAGSQVLELTSSGFFHNGKNIGSPHTHDGVTPGIGNTGDVN